MEGIKEGRKVGSLRSAFTWVAGWGGRRGGGLINPLGLPAKKRGTHLTPKYRNTKYSRHSDLRILDLSMEVIQNRYRFIDTRS